MRQIPRRWLTSTIRAVRSRSRNQETASLYDLVIPLGIVLQVIHQPGVDNVLVNYLFRTCPDSTNWTLDKVTVWILFEMWRILLLDALLHTSTVISQCVLVVFLTQQRLLAMPYSTMGQGCSCPPYLLSPFYRRSYPRSRRPGQKQSFLIAPHGRGDLGTISCFGWHACQVLILLPHKMDLLSQHVPSKGILFHFRLGSCVDCP